MKVTTYKRNLVVALTILIAGAFAATACAYEITIEDDYSYPQYNEWDYGVASADIEFSDDDLYVGQSVIITARVHNGGICDARTGWGWYSPTGRSAWGEWDFDYPASDTVDLSYRCRDDVDVHWRVELDGAHLVSLWVPGCGAGDQWKIVTVHDVPVTAGPHTIFLGTYQMDYYPDYRLDWIEVENIHIEAETYNRMGGNDPDPDRQGLYIYPRAACPPESHNLLVQIWQGDPSSGGILICEDFVGSTNWVVDGGHDYSGYTYEAHYIENGGEGSLECEWTPVEPGTHEIYVIVDPREVLEEINETNNIAQRSINVGDVAGICTFFLTPKKLNVTRNAEHTFMIHLNPCDPMDVSKGDSAEVYVDVDGDDTFDNDERYPAVVNSSSMVIKVYCEDLVDNDPKVVIYSINDIPVSDTLGNDIVLLLDTFTPKGKGPKSLADGSPNEFSLGQNNPNPFNPACEITYALPIASHVTLNVYNLLGQKVRVLVDEYQSAGYKTVSWDSKDDQGQEVTSGVYFYRIQAGDFTEAKKMLLLK